MFASVTTSKSPALVVEANFEVAAERIEGYQAAFTSTNVVEVVHTLGYHPRVIEVYIGGVKSGARIERLSDTHFTVTMSGNQTGVIYFG